MPFGGGFNIFFFDVENFEWTMRSITLGGVLLIAAILCCLVSCLVLMVITLTFDCWWKLGAFFGLDADTLADMQQNGRPYQWGKRRRRKQSKEGKGPEGTISSSPLIAAAFDGPMTTMMLTKQQQNGKSTHGSNGSICLQRTAVNETLEALVALV